MSGLIETIASDVSCLLYLSLVNQEACAVRAAETTEGIPNSGK